MVIIEVNVIQASEHGSEKVIDIKIESTYKDKLDFLLTEDEYQECIEVLTEYAKQDLDGKINISATPTGIAEYFFSSFPFIDYREYDNAVLTYRDKIEKYSEYESEYATFFANFPLYAIDEIENIYLKIMERLNEKQKEIQQEIQEYKQIETTITEIVNSMVSLTDQLKEIYSKVEQLDKRITLLEKKQEEQQSKIRKFIDFLKNPFKYIIPKMKKEKELEKQRLQDELKRLRREREELERQRKEFVERLKEERKRLEELERLRNELERKQKRKNKWRGLER